MDSHHHFQQYIAALYWSVMTITTIGYGDLVHRMQLALLLSIPLTCTMMSCPALSVCCHRW